MNKKNSNWYKVYPIILLVGGILMGYWLHYFVSISWVRGTLKSNIVIDAENDDNPNIRHFAKQLSDQSLVYSISPLTAQIYNDKKRFSIHYDKHLYVIASELYGLSSDGKMEIMRTYAFKEDNNDILFVVTRDSETNKLKSVLYSFGDDISYYDKNGDGVWDIIRGIH